MSVSQEAVQTLELGHALPVGRASARLADSSGVACGRSDRPDVRVRPRADRLRADRRRRARSTASARRRSTSSSWRRFRSGSCSRRHTASTRTTRSGPTTRRSTRSSASSTWSRSGRSRCLIASWVTGAASPQFGKIFAFWLIGIALVSLGRAGARTVCRRQPSYLQNAVIVGCGHVGQTVARKFLNHPEYGVHVVGFIDAEPRDRTVDGRGTCRCSARPSHLRQIVDELRIDRVIIAFSSDSHEDTP